MYDGGNAVSRKFEINNCLFLSVTFYYGTIDLACCLFVQLLEMFLKIVKKLVGYGAM